MNWNILIVNIPAIVMAIGAIILAFYERDGWGWLIFAAMMIVHSPSSKDEE